ncbi:hypothetical protein [Nocardiopsis dassonvillei]|uniref:hypothetical protein n=1 Tax=Nocardiopsis dassonvillei TaxID=2014 RepID=UPI003630B172
MHKKPDYFLYRLVQAADQAGTLFQVTITAQGQLISGTLVSNERWFRHQAERLRNARVDGATASDAAALTEAMGSLFDTWADNVAAVNQERGLEEVLPDTDLDNGEPQYLHLAGARIFSGNTEYGFNNDQMALRIRLTDVTAWTLGAFT